MRRSVDMVVVPPIGYSILFSDGGWRSVTGEWDKWFVLFRTKLIFAVTEKGLESKECGFVPMKGPNHPGDLIRDCLDELGANVSDSAKALSVTRSALSRVINRKAGVSAKMALRLEKALGSTAGFWLRLQLNYDLAQIQRRRG